MSIITRFMASVVEPQFVLARDLMALALADGEVSQEEMEAINDICHLENVDETLLMTSLQNGDEQYKVQVPQSRKEKDDYLRGLIQLIGADEYCSPQEIYLFQVIASKMGLNQMDIVGLFMLTATRTYFHGDAGSKILSSFLKNYIDPLARTEFQNRDNLRRMYETVAANSQTLIDEDADSQLLRENLSKATELLRENRILEAGFRRIGIDFALLLKEEEDKVFERYVRRE